MQTDSHARRDNHDHELNLGVCSEAQVFGSLVSCPVQARKSRTSATAISIMIMPNYAQPRTLRSMQHERFIEREPPL
jgi:hypothetical protein